MNTTNVNKQRVLKGHSIQNYMSNGRLLAMDCWTDSNNIGHGELIDVTDWTMTQVMNWLGY